MDFRFLFRRLLYKLYTFMPQKTIRPSGQAIDVVIPIVQKDLVILPLCLEGIRRCVTNRISQIYIIAPNQKEITDFCRDNQLIYVDETSVLGITPKDIDLIVNGVNRSGWIFQQLLKLSGAIGTEEHFLTVDADHVMIKEHIFLTDKEETVFYMSNERFQCYYDNMKRLCGVKNKSWLSYIDHKMLFSKSRLQELRELIEHSSGKPWIQAIIDSLDRTQTSSFSEFELYGNFCSDGIKRPWKQKTVKFSLGKKYIYNSLINEYSHYLSISFPDYYKNEKTTYHENSEF